MNIPPLVKWFGALLIISAIVYAIYAYGQQQFGFGENAEKDRWLTRENTELTDANDKIKKLEEQYRAQESLHALQLAAVSTKYQEDLKNAKAEKDHVIAGLHTGDIRLHIPVAYAVTPGGSGSPATLACSTGRDGETRCELSTAAAEFLVGIASECNEVAKQLSAAQDIIIKDRSIQQ